MIMTQQFGSHIERSTSTYRDAAFLASCSEDGAVAWLESRPVEVSRVMGTRRTPPDAHLLECILLRRRRPAIDRALAEHGRSLSVLERLYDRSSGSLRVLACSNPSLFFGDSIASGWREKPLAWEIIYNGSLAELRALCEIPDSPSPFYGGLITAWKPEAERKDEKIYLSDDRFIFILRSLSKNPRKSIAREDSAEATYHDGFAEYDYNRFFTEAWKLAEVVPVTNEWAAALAELYQGMHVPFKSIDDVDAVIARWRVEDEEDLAPTRYVRAALAAAFVKPTLDQLHHDDIAMRDAFYQKFDPKNRDFADLNWDDWIDERPSIFVDMSQNDRIWASSVSRSKFRGMLWHGSSRDSDLLWVGMFDDEVEKLRVSNPEWFSDREDGEDYVLERGISADPTTQLRREIRALISGLGEKRKSASWIVGAGVLGLIVGLIIG